MHLFCTVMSNTRIGQCQSINSTCTTRHEPFWTTCVMSIRVILRNVCLLHFKHENLHQLCCKIHLQLKAFASSICHSFSQQKQQHLSKNRFQPQFPPSSHVSFTKMHLNRQDSTISHVNKLLRMYSWTGKCVFFAVHYNRLHWWDTANTRS